MTMVTVQDVARGMQIDFIEWPMLRVTLRQACRLWDVPHDVCEAALLSLVRAEFLLDRDGMFFRPVRPPFAQGAVMSGSGPSTHGDSWATPAA